MLIFDILCLIKCKRNSKRHKFMRNYISFRHDDLMHLKLYNENVSICNFLLYKLFNSYNKWKRFALLSFWKIKYLYRIWNKFYSCNKLHFSTTSNILQRIYVPFCEHIYLKIMINNSKVLHPNLSKDIISLLILNVHLKNIFYFYLRN